MIQHVVLLTFGIVAEFETRGDSEVYRDHPAHRQVTSDHIGPIRAERAAIRFDR